MVLKVQNWGDAERWIAHSTLQAAPISSHTLIPHVLTALKFQSRLQEVCLLNFYSLDLVLKLKF